MADYVQSKDDGGVGSATTVAATFGSAVGSGSVVCGLVGWDEGSAHTKLTSVDDDQANSYTIVRYTDSIYAATASFYLANITNAPITITATFSSGVTARMICVHEVAGRDTTSPLDGENGQTQTSPGTGTDAVTSGTFTPATDGCYIFGYSRVIAADPTLTVGTGFTIRISHTGSYVRFTEDQVQTSAGSIAATWTTPNGTSIHSTFGMAFKPVAAGGGGTILPQMMQHHRGRFAHRRTREGVLIPTHREVMQHRKAA